MKCVSALVLVAGVASAVAINTNIQNSVQASGVNVGSNNNVQAASLAGLFNSSALNGSNINIGNANFDPASLGLGNIAGINLGQLDFSNQNDVIAAILAMMNAICLGSLFNQDSILALGQNNDMALLLELVQLMQLEQLGFLKLGDVQSLLMSAFLTNNNNNNNNNVIGSNNAFNLGFFKRAVEERKKTMKRTVLRRATKTRSKRQCQAGVVDPNVAVTVVPGVTAPLTSLSLEASATPKATVAPAVAQPAATETPAAAPVVAQPVPAPAAPAEENGDSLSDFTR